VIRIIISYVQQTYDTIRYGTLPGEIFVWDKGLGLTAEYSRLTYLEKEKNKVLMRTD
jgi:hypothetical protein